MNSERLKPLRAILTDFYCELGAFVRSQAIGPSPNSQGSREQAEFSSSDYLVTALASGRLFIELAGEHVMQLEKSLTAPIMPQACLTCVRSMLEASGLASWLFDPTIDARERMKRMVALHYKGIEELLKYKVANRVPQEGLNKMKAQIDASVQEAVDLGFDRITDRKGKLISVGQRMPSATEMIRDQLGEESLYRILSGVAHCHSWAISFLAYDVSRKDMNQVGGDDIYQGNKRLTDPIVKLLVTSAVIALAKPAWAQCQYLGWEQGRLSDIFEETFDRLQSSSEDRFWR